ncbi:MAG TPA: pseudouridine synthase [Roseiflexaceae bacterium]|nr:pseudouridine synthase [Roseiflexaceae bacterium]
MSPERLQKVLASAGVASRRDCEELISAGRVTVNGRVVRVLGARVDPEQDEIAVDGERVALTPKRSYLMLHKPRGVVSTAEDTHDRPTVVELVGADTRVFPVGRLDMDSEGLLLLTDDGTLTQRLTHPSFAVEKEYRALLDRAPSPEAIRAWRTGVELEGVPTAPAWVDLIEQTDEGAWVRVVLQEGRKRQIREVAKLLGYEVLRLIRVREGPLTLGDLPPGAWRPLTEEEQTALWDHVGGRPAEETMDNEELEQSAAAPRRSRPPVDRTMRPIRRPRPQAFDQDPNAQPDNEAADQQPARPERDSDRGPRDFNRRDDRPREGGYDRGPRDFNRRDDRPREGGYDRGPRDFNRRDDRPREGGYDRGPRDFNRRDDRPREGGYDRGPRDFNRRDDRPREGGFNRGPREGFGRRDDRPREGGYDRGPRDFNRRDDGPPREGANRGLRDGLGRANSGSREGGYNRGPRDFNRRDDRPREGGFNRGPRDFNRRDDRPREGGFNRGPRDFNRRDDGPPREGGFNRGPREGGFNRGPREGFGRRDDRPREGGFNRGPRDFNRRDDGPPREGGFNRGPREGGFNRGPREGFGRRDDRPREGGFDRGPRDFNRRDDRPREGGFNRGPDRPEREARGPQDQGDRPKRPLPSGLRRENRPSTFGGPRRGVRPAFRPRRKEDTEE